MPTNDNDDVDLYGDLPEFNLEATIQKLETENKALTQKVKDLTARVSELETQNNELSRMNKNLKANISALVKTVQGEIQRKDNTIAELRQEREDLFFRRNKPNERGGRGRPPKNQDAGQVDVNEMPDRSNVKEERTRRSTRQSVSSADPSKQKAPTGSVDSRPTVPNAEDTNSAHKALRSNRRKESSDPAKAGAVYRLTPLPAQAISADDFQPKRPRRTASSEQVPPRESLEPGSSSTAVSAKLAEQGLKSPETPRNVETKAEAHSASPKKRARRTPTSRLYVKTRSSARISAKQNSAQEVSNDAEVSLLEALQLEERSQPAFTNSPLPAILSPFKDNERSMSPVSCLPSAISSLLTGALKPDRSTLPSKEPSAPAPTPPSVSLSISSLLSGVLKPNQSTTSSAPPAAPAFPSPRLPEDSVVSSLTGSTPVSVLKPEEPRLRKDTSSSMPKDPRKLPSAGGQDKALKQVLRLGVLSYKEDSSGSGKGNVRDDANRTNTILRKDALVADAVANKRDGPRQEESSRKEETKQNLCGLPEKRPDGEMPQMSGVSNKREIPRKEETQEKHGEEKETRSDRETSSKDKLLRNEDAKLREEKLRKDEERRKEEAKRREENLRKEEECRKEEERRKEEAKRREENLRTEEERRKEEAERREETLRKEEERRKEDSKRREETLRKEEERRKEEAKRREETLRKEDERRKEEAKRREEQHRKEEAKLQEEKLRIEEAIRREDERQKEAKRREEQHRKEEAKRREEQHRKEEAKRREDQHRKEEERQKEEAKRREEQRRKEEERWEEEAKRRAETVRKEEERRKEEAKRREEQRRKEEAKRQEERRKEEAKREEVITRMEESENIRKEAGFSSSETTAKEASTKQMNGVADDNKNGCLPARSVSSHVDSLKPKSSLGGTQSDSSALQCDFKVRRRTRVQVKMIVNTPPPTPSNSVTSPAPLAFPANDVVNRIVTPNPDKPGLTKVVENAFPEASNGLRIKVRDQSPHNRYNKGSSEVSPREQFLDKRTGCDFRRRVRSRSRSPPRNRENLPPARPEHRHPKTFRSPPRHRLSRKDDPRTHHLLTRRSRSLSPRLCLQRRNQRKEERFPPKLPLDRKERERMLFGKSPDRRPQPRIITVLNVKRNKRANFEDSVDSSELSSTHKPQTSSANRLLSTPVYFRERHPDSNPGESDSESGAISSGTESSHSKDSDDSYRPKKRRRRTRTENSKHKSKKLCRAENR